MTQLFRHFEAVLVHKKNGGAGQNLEPVFLTISKDNRGFGDAKKGALEG